MDIAPTLMNHWLACVVYEREYSVGSDISTYQQTERVSDNTLPEWN